MNAPAGSPVVLSWSGGKDAAATLLALRGTGVRVTALLTTFAGTRGSSGHGVPQQLIAAQADALGLPLVSVELPEPCSGADYEHCVAAALSHPAVDGVTTMAFGDLFLEDHRTYRTAFLAAHGWNATFPLWRRDTSRLAREIIATPIDAIVVAVDLDVLDERLLGRHFDAALLAEIPAHADPCAETGEFHTYVVDMPGFTQPVPVERSAVTHRDGHAYLDVHHGPHDQRRS